MSGVTLGEIHRDIAAVGMPDHRQVVVIGFRINPLQFVDHEHDIGDAAVIVRAAADIFLAD
jgi:hypothetical protein